MITPLTILSGQFILTGTFIMMLLLVLGLAWLLCYMYDPNMRAQRKAKKLKQEAQAHTRKTFPDKLSKLDYGKAFNKLKDNPVMERQTPPENKYKCPLCGVGPDEPCPNAICHYDKYNLGY